MNHKEQPSAIRDLFYEARAELAKDTDSIQYKEDQKSIDVGIICLFCRITTHLKSVELLYANDLALEADVILRGCLESIFWMGALINQPDTVEKMENEFKYQQYSMRKNILEAAPALMKLDPDVRRTMERAQVGARVKRNDRISLFEVARRAEIPAMYIPFSNLSNSAAHASIHSLNRHLAMKQDATIDYFTALVTDPNWEATFHLACSIAFFTKHFLNQRFTLSGREWENGLWERLQKISNKTDD